MNTWMDYFNKHRLVIEQWIQQFAGSLWEKYEQTPKTEEELVHVLNECWFIAPDSSHIRTSGFFRLTDLLDGSWE